MKKSYIVFFLWLIGFTTVSIVSYAVRHDPIPRAFVAMGIGLFLLWNTLGGFLMWRLRDPVKRFIENTPLGWRTKFVLFCTFLALIEEAITTTMTNLAPIFGVPVGTAFLTSSTNYFHVVLLHSVVIFIPMFIVWAWILAHYRFTPLSVFFLFGVTGWLGESVFDGLQNLLNPGLWVFVYGLMVYLPAYSLPESRQTTVPRWRHYLLVIFLPYVIAMPFAAIVSYMHPVGLVEFRYRTSP